MIKLKCINDHSMGIQRFCKLRFGMVYTLSRMVPDHANNWKDDRLNCVQVKEIPGINFLAKRFEVIGKLSIDLPHDINIFPI